MAKEKRFMLWDSEKKEKVQVTARKEGQNWVAFCSWHDDAGKANLYIDEEMGTYHCFRCGAKGCIYNPAFEKSVLKPEHCKFLRDRGHDYTAETVKRFGLRSEKYHGQEIICYNFQNVKRYLLVSEKGIDGTWRSFRGHKVTVMGDFAPKELILVEGEHDLMMGWQKGLRGVCSFTGGAMALPAFDKLRVFEGKDLVIIYDNDKAGREGAEKVGKAVFEIIHLIKIVQLPVQGNGGDLTDYFYNGGTKEDLLRRIDQCVPWGHPNFRELYNLMQKYRDKIYSSSEVKDTNRGRLFSLTCDLIDRANIYTGQFKATFSEIGEPYKLKRVAVINILSRNLKQWEILDWKGNPGRSSKTTFALKEYPKVRF